MKIYVRIMSGGAHSGEIADQIVDGKYIYIYIYIYICRVVVYNCTYCIGAFLEMCMIIFKVRVVIWRHIYVCKYMLVEILGIFKRIFNSFSG
jgi:hypothetical protein